MNNSHKPSSINHPLGDVRRRLPKQEPSSGLIRKSDLAMKYFPHASTPKIARDNLTRWINRCKPLHVAMSELHYNTHDWHYTPRQVALIYEYLGSPD